MSTPSARVIRRWFSVTDRAEKRRLVAYARRLLDEHPTLAPTAFPLVADAAHLAEVRLPALRREHDSALRRRRQTQARRARRGLAASSRALRALLQELREDAGRHQSDDFDLALALRGVRS